jgi:RNA polymerase sigma factor (sigma-70 family)
VRRHQSLAQRAAWLVTGSAEEAADATQEGFVKAWRALDRFREGAEFRPWLLRIVVNTARNRRRSAWRFDAMRARATAEYGNPTAVSAETTAMDHAEHDALIAALRRLGGKDREVVACRYLLDLSEAETAEILGCARGTVKSRLSRALERLRVEMETLQATTAGGAT